MVTGDPVWILLLIKAYLENAVQSSFIANKHVVAVFFDLEKAFYRTWRFYMLFTIAINGVFEGI